MKNYGELIFRTLFNREHIVIGETIIFVVFSTIVLGILSISLKKNKISLIKGIQVGFIVFFIGETVLWLMKYGKTTGCADFDFNYKLQIIFFCLTSIVSYFLYKKGKQKKDILLYTPILFIIAFIFVYTSYRLGYLGIYEAIASGTNFVNRPECDFLLLKLLK